MNLYVVQLFLISKLTSIYLRVNNEVVAELNLIYILVAGVSNFQYDGHTLFLYIKNVVEGHFCSGFFLKQLALVHLLMYKSNV